MLDRLSDEKREVITRLGSDLLMDNKKVRINLKKYLIVASEQAKWNEKYKDWIEPQEYTELLAKRPDLRPAIPVWLRRLKAVRTYFLEQILNPTLPTDIRTNLTYIIANEPNLAFSSAKA